MQIDRDQWMRLSPLLDEALELAPDELIPWLDGLSRRQPDLAPTVRELIGRLATVETDEFLETFAIHGLSAAQPDTPGFEPACHVGPYLLQEEVGRGGMGIVWRAIGEEGTLRRTVALKLLTPGIHGADLLEHFERERDILASLEHPNIARLYDAGVTPSGQPYLALEFVAGQAIDKYCDARTLTARGRLELFRQVLTAVEFAHSRLVIHRDLKPSNVLVSADGEVRLLDFGVAKLLLESTADHAFTELTVRQMTPRYAAPEQIAGEPMSTATDVYALGVLLYELLAGCSPYRVDRQTRRNLERAVLECDPLPPSENLTEQAAHLRGSTPPRLRAALRGDLDTIILKALKKRPAERYATVNSLLQDIDRHLSGVPVLAVADSAWYRLSKFVRRNRAISSLTAALVVALLVGSVGIAWQALRARHEALRAEHEAAREKATKEFLIGVFSATDPRLPADKPRSSMTATELLEAGAQHIGTDLAQDPETQIELLGVVTEIFGLVEDYERYNRFHPQLLQLLTSRFGSADIRVTKATLDEVHSAIVRGDRPGAARLLQRAEELIRGAGLQQSREGAHWWQMRAEFLQTEEQASVDREDALRRAIALYARAAPRDPAYAGALISLGGVYFMRDQDGPAIQLIRQAAGVLQSAFGPEYAELAPVYHNMAMAEAELGDFDPALKDLEHALHIAGSTYGTQSMLYTGMAASYAQLLHRRGRRSPALAIFESLLPPGNSGRSDYADFYSAQSAGMVHENYGECLLAEGRPMPAIPLLEAAIRIFASRPEFSGYKHTFAIHLALGEAYAGVGRSSDARRELQSLVENIGRARPPDDPLVLSAREAWGRFLLRQGQKADAAAQFQMILSEAHGRDIAPVALAYGDLGLMAAAQGRMDQARDWSARAVSMAQRARTEPDVRLTAVLGNVRAKVLIKTGDRVRAREWANRAVDADKAYDDAQSTELADAQETLRQALE